MARARTAEQRRRAERAVRRAVKTRNAAQKAFSDALRGPKPVALTLQSNTPTSFKLGRSPSPGNRSVLLRLALDRPPVDTPIDVRPGLFVRESDGLQMPQGMHAWAGVSQHKSVRVGFCIDPATRLKMHPGTYQGSLVVVDPRVQSIDVPVSFTVSYPHMKILIAAALVLCLLASIFTYTLRKPNLEHMSYPRWTTSLIGALTIASGLIGATIVFAAQYLDADVWGENHTQLFAFIGAVTTAFITGATAGKLAQNEYDKKDKGGQVSQIGD